MAIAGYSRLRTRPFAFGILMILCSFSLFYIIAILLH